ncbi:MULTISPECIES: hypothetical protein [Sorangium]|uniref:Uncharacterized protein n=2 Tax=Sorangium cellulosum TaxID=56 RepID=A0A150R678_SORCE|nr:hypothetical protein [Sorangium cellulosum]HTN86304.1 hypothetical protein [Sorangium sp.]AGP39831.1 hypothetical protein SCE1572_38270 [Sorangium cellulosum So0157-2]KYF52189.1 hypothetical protein BE04_28340 [Sorangium cellulosum]KYF75764.1 hypothetical protein BE17_06065 [Sorangium cellulosum]KYF90015.1 hypothetical protein BE18_39215 [Sorangium cellulosum]
MSNITSELKSDLTKSLESLQTLRDEIRVRLHLAGMEAKDAWGKLEPTLLDAEKLAEDVSETSRNALRDILEKVKEFRSSLPS